MGVTIRGELGSGEAQERIRIDTAKHGERAARRDACVDCYLGTLVRCYLGRLLSRLLRWY